MRQVESVSAVRPERGSGCSGDWGRVSRGMSDAGFWMSVGGELGVSNAAGEARALAVNRQSALEGGFGVSSGINGLCGG